MPDHKTQEARPVEAALHLLYIKWVTENDHANADLHNENFLRTGEYPQAFLDTLRPSVSDILTQGAKTFEERNKVYGNNYLRVGGVMAALFPNGVMLRTPEEFVRWHNFELLVVKLSRFAVSGLTHQDSMHDSMVYSAMLESFLTKDTQPIGEAK
jgi:hypothetical protein